METDWIFVQHSLEADHNIKKKKKKEEEFSFKLLGLVRLVSASMDSPFFQGKSSFVIYIWFSVEPGKERNKDID